MPLISVPSLGSLVMYMVTESSLSTVRTVLSNGALPPLITIIFLVPPVITSGNTTSVQTSMDQELTNPPSCGKSSVTVSIHVPIEGVEVKGSIA